MTDRDWNALISKLPEPPCNIALSDVVLAAAQSYAEQSRYTKGQFLFELACGLQDYAARIIELETDWDAMKAEAARWDLIALRSASKSD